MSERTPEVHVDQLATALLAGAMVIDVREAGEYVGGHIPGAVFMPMWQLPGRIDELVWAAPVYVVCASGNRSAAVTDYLLNGGFTAFSVAGGTAGWARSGRDLANGVSP